MKKSVFIIAAVAATVFIGSQVVACDWSDDTRGYWSDHRDDGRYQKFHDATAKLRQDLAAKQAEFHALMATANPNPKQVAKLSKEITALQDQLRSKARDYRVRGWKHNYRHGRMGGCGCW